MTNTTWLSVSILVVAVLVTRRTALRSQLDLTWLVYLAAPLNWLRFHARRALGIRLGAPELRGEPMEGLFDYLDEPQRSEAVARERALRARFDLEALERSSTKDVYRQNLYVLDVLDRIASPALPSTLAEASHVRALDVGSQDFRYATALERWLARGLGEHPAKVSLDGIELDGHVLRGARHTRADYGDAHARLTGNPRVRYRVEDFARSTDRDIDVVFFWFPFVLRYALVRWGLPLAAFAPERLFKRAHEALRPGGLLVVVNHTHEERERQVALLTEAGGWRVLGTWPVESLLVDYHLEVPERAMTLAIRV